MKTIQIFNKSISKCKECIYFRHFEFYDDVFCTLQDKIINDFETIDETCPFAKPLSKEDIESFGFEYNDKDDLFILKDFKIWKSISENNVYIIHNIKNNNIMNFKITSKPHLEFILKSLNII